MKIATWNVERLKHKNSLDRILTHCNQQGFDILVLTETDSRIAPDYQYSAKSACLAELDNGLYCESENRVSIYTNYRIVTQYPTYNPYSAICVELETELGNIIVYCTIMGAFGNRHPGFIDDVRQQCDDIRRLSEERKPLCICGDFNLSFSDNYYFTKTGQAIILEAFQDCNIEITTRDLPECIDHIAMSSSLKEGTIKGSMGAWNEDKTLSDHKGVFVSIDPESDYVLDFDFYFSALQAGKFVDETCFFFSDDPQEEKHYIGFLPLFEKPYWVSYCDIEGGTEFFTADELVSAAIFDGKSLRERWGQVRICGIEGLSLRDWLESTTDNRCGTKPHFGKLEAGTVITKDDGSIIEVPKALYVLATEPVPDLTAEQFVSEFPSDMNDKQLATMLATVWNEAGWLLDELEEDDCPNEVVERCHGWEMCQKSLVEQVANRIGKQPPERGWYRFIKPFMEQNDFQASNGWWVPKSEAF